MKRPDRRDVVAATASLARSGSRSLIASKLRLPPLPQDTIARPRLDTLLAPADGPNITFVIAQAGWGKTVAVRDWVRRAGARVAWLTIDASDDHPVRFWHDVLFALDTALPGTGLRSIESLLASSGHDDAFVSVLVNDVAADGRPAVLVLDDLHAVRDRGIHDSLASLVEHLPGNLRLVLVAREQPPLPIARWRARGLIGEVSEPELAFRRDEAAALLASFEDLDLADDEVEMLLERTEGWAAGLQLAGLSPSRSHDASGEQRVSAGTGPAAEMLIRDLLALQPADIQDFLRATSIVECFNAALCRVLTGRTDAQAVLRTIEDRRLFLVALDTHREWFRYHQLFRELLAADLERRDPEAFRGLNAAAAEWFGDHGDVRLAVWHMLRAGDTDRAFELAISATPGAPASRSGRSEWLDLLPPDYIAADPERIARFVVALVMHSSFTDAEIWMEKAEAALARHPSPAFARKVAAMRAVFAALRGDADRAVRDGAALFPIDAELGAHDVVFERLPVNLARSHLLLGDVAAARAATELLDTRDGLSEVATLVVIPAIRARIAVAEGRLTEAKALAADALRHGSGAPHGHFGTLDAHLALARLFIERDDVMAAERELEELADLSADLDSVVHGTFAELGHALLAWRRDELEGVESRLARARARAARSSGAALAHRVDLLEARICIRTGAFVRAAALTTMCPAGVERSLLEARLELRSEPVEARARLEQLHPTTRRDRIVKQLLLARAGAGTAAAEDHVRAAEELAEPEGFTWVFWEDGLLPTAPAAAEAALAASFSERELTVLGQLAGSSTNAEIARALFISGNTLKTHVRSIYRKLGVGSREEAVASAHRLGLLTPRGTTLRAR